MPHRSTTAGSVVVAFGLITIGCANQPQEQQTNMATTRPAQAAAVATPPAPVAPVRPPAPMTPPAPATRPAAPVASAPPTTGRTYTIKPGDSLWKISKEVYGDATKYEQIQKANPTIDPQLLKPGTVIVIP